MVTAVLIRYRSITSKDNEVEQLYPAINRRQFADQVPAIKKQFLYHKDYAKASFSEIFQGKTRDSLLKLNVMKPPAAGSRICNGKFVKRYLPMEAQFAPVNAIVCDDLMEMAPPTCYWQAMNTRPT